MEVRRLETLKNGTEIIGTRTRIKIVKNKIAPPFKQADFDIMYGEGVSREGNILDLGVDLDIVKKSGAWYSYQDTRLGQGRENAKIFLKENTAIADEIAAMITQSFRKNDE